MTDSKQRQTSYSIQLQKVRVDFVFHLKDSMARYSVELEQGARLKEAVNNLPIAIKFKESQIGSWVEQIAEMGEIDKEGNRTGFGWQFYIHKQNETGLPYTLNTNDSQDVFFPGINEFKVSHNLLIEWKYECYSCDIDTKSLFAATNKTGEAYYLFTGEEKKPSKKENVILANLEKNKHNSSFYYLDSDTSRSILQNYFVFDPYLSASTNQPNLSLVENEQNYKNVYSSQNQSFIDYLSSSLEPGETRPFFNILDKFNLKIGTIHKLSLNSPSVIIVKSSNFLFQYVKRFLQPTPIYAMVLKIKQSLSRLKRVLSFISNNLKQLYGRVFSIFKINLNKLIHSLRKIKERVANSLRSFYDFRIRMQKIVHSINKSIGKRFILKVDFRFNKIKESIFTRLNFKFVSSIISTLQTVKSKDIISENRLLNSRNNLDSILFNLFQLSGRNYFALKVLAVILVFSILI